MRLGIITREQAIREGVSIDSIRAVADWHRTSAKQAWDQFQKKRHLSMVDRLELLAATMR